MDESNYDPFVPGPLTVDVRTFEARDNWRGRVFPCDLWYPAGSGPWPLIVYSHSSGGNRHSATFLCRHLASHGYVVAALDHSERVVSDLARRDNETPAERSARIDAVIASRVPDVRFLLDFLMYQGTEDESASALAEISLDVERIGLAGHSFGGWTVLATVEADPRVRSVVAMVPGGGSNPRPGILPVTLSFDCRRDVPTLYLAAEDDVLIPLPEVEELFWRTPGPKRMFILRRADHQHFVDEVELEHEALRTAVLPAESAWISAAMRPIAELASGEQAHLFVRGLTLAHLDATLKGSEPAGRFLAGEVIGELAARGVEAMACQP